MAEVIAPWGGAAFDTTRNRLIVRGGGHGDYSGNEIYSFSLDTLTWTRLTGPGESSPGAAPKNTYYNDQGTPSSRHTYNCLQDLSHLTILYMLSEGPVSGGMVIPVPSILIVSVLPRRSG